MAVNLTAARWPLIFKADSAGLKIECGRGLCHAVIVDLKPAEAAEGWRASNGELGALAYDHLANDCMSGRLRRGGGI
jgi:hypothetical protein